MTEKEIAEIRRRYKAGKNSISHVRGCYVSQNGEIISEFDESLGLMSEDETDEILALLRKTLSGGIESNLFDVEFTTGQVLDSSEHKLLMNLRESKIADDEIAHEFYDRVIESIHMEESYLILLTNEVYDVFAYSKDGKREEDSSETFSYILCSICPVKLTKPALTYQPSESVFRNIGVNTVISAPELGFMFPAFDDRSTNIYNLLFYSKNTADNHEEFVDSIFKSRISLPAAVQKETFQDIINETIGEDCSLAAVKEVHDSLYNMIEENKENTDEPSFVSGKDVSRILKSTGVKEEKLEAFEKHFDESFGEDARLRPQNIVNQKQIEVQTCDISIKASLEASENIEIRKIDGIKYIMIRADSSVEYNGVRINALEEVKEKDDEI